MRTDDHGARTLPPDGDDDEAAEIERTRRRRRRIFTALGVSVLVLLLLVGGGVWYLTDRYAGNVDRVGDVFADIPEDSRPAPASPTAAGVGGTPETFLLIGSDSREATAEGAAPGARSDTIMIAR